MMKSADPRRLCAAAVIVIAGLAMTGWAFGVEPLKSVFPGLAAMNPLTALLFLSAGMVMVRSKDQALVLPAGVLLALMGSFRLLGCAGWDLGMDTLMFRRALEACSPPNRMAPNTSLGFIMTGLALAVLGRREPWSAKAGQSLALASMWLALFALLGYSYRVPRFYGIGSFMPMALNTALCFALVNSAILLARRDEGWMACVSDEGTGGIMARRLLPFTVLIPALLGFLWLQGQWAGWYNTQTGTALFAISLIAAFSGLVWYTASLLGRIDLARRVSERERDHYARFFSLSVDMFCIADFDGYFKELSDAWEIVLGHPKEEMLKRPYMDFIHPEDRPMTATEAVKNAQGVSTLSFENRYRCKDGSFKWLLWTARPVAAERLIYAVARDITQRKRIEEAMARNLKALADFKAALDEHAIVAITDARGGITYVNDKFCAISKYSREELLGRDHRIVNSGHHPKAFMRALWETIAGGRVWHGEMKNRAKDGSFYWVDTTIVPLLNEDGKPVQYIAIRADISERKQDEQALLDYAGRLEQSNRELDAFSYSVSHDLRAPLRAIDGFSQVVLEDYADRLDDAGKDSLSRIRRGCQQMGELIDDLINLSRVIRHEPRMEETDLSVIARSVMEKLKNADRGRDVRFAAPASASARGDAGLLRAALENLLGNAWKFTGKKKDATIEFGVSKKGGETVYFVKDNGAGFDMAYANKLFGAFQRLHSQEEFPGTGIGLATIQRIVHRHGGRIWAEAAIDRGAAFYFTLNSKEGPHGNKQQDDPVDRGQFK